MCNENVFLLSIHSTPSFPAIASLSGSSSIKEVVVVCSSLLEGSSRSTLTLGTIGTWGSLLDSEICIYQSWSINETDQY